MRPLTLLYAFLGGAIVGAGAALLFAPEKGDELRGQIKTLLQKYGICRSCDEKEMDELIDQIEEDIKEAEKA